MNKERTIKISKANIKWRTVIGLSLIYLSLALYPGYQWIWGALLLYWVIPEIFTGSAYFLEPVHRSKNPVLYWLIIITWLVLGSYIIVEAIL